MQLLFMKEKSMCFAGGDAVFQNFLLALDEEACKTFMLKSPFWSKGKEF